MTNDEKKTLLQQRYAELDDESLCALERHKLTEQARELFDAELARRGLDLAAYEARHSDSLYRSRTALRRRQWRGVGLKAILAGIIFAGAALVRQQYGASLDAVAWHWSSLCWPLPCVAAEAPVPVGQGCIKAPGPLSRLCPVCALDRRPDPAPR